MQSSRVPPTSVASSSRVWALTARLALSLGAALVAACGDDDGPACTVAADCASGVCMPDGRCATVDGGVDATVTPDGGSGDDGGAEPAADSGSAGDAAPTFDASDDASDGPDGGLVDDGAIPANDGGPPDAGRDSGALSCLPNLDGVIERREVPLGAGFRANFRTAIDVAFDSAGTMEVDGARRWDLSVAFPGDTTVVVETYPLTGAWFEGDFPGATYASQLSSTADLLGVFEVTPDALLLRGVVSPMESGNTNVSYDPPVTVLRFPLQFGATWTTDSVVSGTTPLFPFGTAYSEEYVSEVDAAGALVTAFGTFPVMRVRTELARSQVGVPLASVLTHSFVSECFGTVASIVAADGEDGPEFSQAAELKRLTP